MTKDAFERAMTAFRRRSPFEPFVVELISGTKLLIEHPEALMGRGSIAVFIAKDGELTILDHKGVARFTSDVSDVVERSGDAGAA